MATAGLKLDDGTGGFASNCFPVRTLIRQTDEAAGAWLVAHRAEQRKRFKAILCTRPKTFSQIREERKKSEKPNFTSSQEDTARENRAAVLDGFFLLRHCCVEDPSHLCSINISGQEFSDVQEEDLEVFDNVAYINASENYLPFDAFNHFPILRELEMPLNGLRGLHIQPGAFPHLEMLDLSYNNLSQQDVLALGVLQNLKVLQLSGNNFRVLPEEMALPFKDSNGSYQRYPKLEVLMLDDNKFSDVNVFACLAGLRCLRQLNLEKNELYFVPQLLVSGGKVQTRDEKHIHKKNGKINTRRPQSGRKRQETRISDLLEQRIQNTPRTDLLNDDFSTEDLSARINDLQLGREITQPVVEDGEQGLSSVTVLQEAIGPPPPPFSELRYLNLAHNQFTSEEALLGVAAWPMLAELMIYHNPLTDEHVGDPPLLKRFLADRLGISLVRKKPQPPGKKHVEVSTKKSRKVKTTVAKIPRLSIEERLMLEAPDSFPERRVQSSAARHHSLPPLSTSSEAKQRPSSADEAGQGRSAEGSKVHVEKDIQSPTHQAWDEEEYFDDPMENPFFMTQPEESAEKIPDDFPKKTAHQLELENMLQDEKYRGFEALLDIDPDLDFKPPKDITGNVRALKYALGHELIYRDPAAQLDTVQKPLKPQKPSQPRKPTKTRQQRVNEMLNNLKTRQTLEEAELREVLHDKKMMRKKFPEAEILLDEIQRRYNSVRVQSMNEATSSRNVIQETLQDVNRANSINKNREGTKA